MTSGLSPGSVVTEIKQQSSMPIPSTARETSPGKSTAATTATTTADPPGNQSGPAGHTFLSGVQEVKDMESGLLSLLNQFHGGELSAFGRGRSLETMEAIRAEQERLARLHFDLASKQEASGTTSHQQNWLSESDSEKLVDGLRELSVDIENINKN